MFGMFNMIRIGIIGTLFAAIGGSAYYYHTTTQGAIEKLSRANEMLIEANSTLRSNVEIMKDAVQTANETVTDLEEANVRIRKEYEKVSTRFKTIRLRNEELRESITTRNLNTSTVGNLSLLEDEINRSTADSLRCFELQMGAPLTEEEKNAKDEYEFNSSCSWIFFSTDRN